MGRKILKIPSIRNCFTLAMINKLVVIINSLKVPKIKKILLYEMKFLVPYYSCLQKPWLGGYRPQISFPLSSVLNCPPNKIPGYATDWDGPLSNIDKDTGYSNVLRFSSDTPYKSCNSISIRTGSLPSKSSPNQHPSKSTIDAILTSIPRLRTRLHKRAIRPWLSGKHSRRSVHIAWKWGAFP